MKNTIDRHVGARLRGLRQARGMSVQKLADAVSIPVERLMALEEGAERISADLMRRFSRELKAAPAEFFEGFSVTARGVVRLSGDDAKAADEESRLVRDFARVRDDNARQLILSMVSSYAAFEDLAKD